MTQATSALYIVGTGGQGRVVAAIAAVLGYDIAGFLDGHAKGPGDPIHRIPMLGHYELLVKLAAPRVVVAIGNNEARARVMAEILRIQPTVTFPTISHPRATVEWQAVCGDGSVLCAGSVLGAGVTAGKGLILNTLASVDHDCVVGDFVHVSPGAHVAGGVHIGDGTWIGIGASVIEGVRIGKNVTVGAGAAVIENVPDGATVVGVPARAIAR